MSDSIEQPFGRKNLGRIPSRFLAIFSGLATCICAIEPCFAQGTLYRWTITGTVVNTLHRGGPFVLNRPYTLQIDLDPSVPDQFADPAIGAYMNSLVSIRFEYDGDVYVGQEQAPPSETYVLNDFEEFPDYFGDSLSLSAELGKFPSHDGQVIQSFYLSLMTGAKLDQMVGPPFTTDAVPTVLDPADFSWTLATLRFRNDAGQTTGNDFSVDHIQIVAIPEPEALWLSVLICGSLIAVWVTKRKIVDKMMSPVASGNDGATPRRRI